MPMPMRMKSDDIHDSDESEGTPPTHHPEEKRKQNRQEHGKYFEKFRERQ